MEELLKFRQKFPQYKDIEDAALVNMLSRKYPQYADLRDKYGSSVGTRIQDRESRATDIELAEAGIKNPVGTAIAETADTFTSDVANIGKHFGNQFLANAPRSISNTIGKPVDFEAKTPMGTVLARTAGVAGAVVSPLNKLAFGKGLTLGQRAGAGAAAGFAYSPDEDFTNVGQRLGQATLGAAVPAAGHMISKIPKATQEAPATVINSLIKPLLKDFSYGKNPGAGVAREGIVANNWDEFIAKIGQKEQEIGKQIGDAVENADVKFNFSDDIKYIDEALGQAKKYPNTNSALIKRLEDLREDIFKGKDLSNLTAKQANALKQDIGELAKWTGNQSDDALVNKALKRTYGSIKEKISKGIPEIADLNERFADITTAKIAAIYRDKISSRQNLLGLAPKAAGYGSAILGVASGNLDSVLAGISVIGIDKLLGSVYFKTRLAAGLSKLGPKDKSKVINKFPELKGFVDNLKGMKNTSGIMESYDFNPLKKTESGPKVLGLPVPEPLPAPKPKYLQEREIIPPLRAPVGEAKVIPPSKIEVMPVPRKERVVYDPKAPEGAVLDVSKLKGNKKLLNDPISEFNPVKSQPKKSDVKNKIAAIGAGLALAGGFAGESQAAQDIDIKRINMIESSNNPKAIGDGGKAFGLNQIHLGTLSDFNKKNKKNYSKEDLMDGKKNNEVANWYFNKKIPRMLKAKGHADTVRNRIIAYNAGISHVGKKIIPKTTFEYIQKYNSGGSK